MTDSPFNLHSTEPASDKRERRRAVVWLLGALVLVLLGGLVAQQLFLWSVVPGPERAIEALVLLALSSVILLLFVIIAFILVRNLLKLRRERGEGRFGSRLKTRLVTYFIALSLLPITVMALFSYTFLNRSLEKWFGSFPQDIVTEAKRAQTFDAEQSQENLRRDAELAGTIVQSLVPTDILHETTTRPDEPLDLNDLAQRSNFDELLVVNADGQVLARGASVEGENALLRQPLAAQLASATASTAPLYTVSFNNILFDVARISIGDGTRFVVVARERRGNERLRDLVLAAEKFEQLRLSQRWVRGLGLTTLALLTLLLLFATTWTADYLARSIVTPLRSLADASEEIARGNLAHRVSEIADDELAALAASFNSMTSELEENRRRIEAGAQELNSKNRALEERRAYIETVLASLSTGVVSLDEHDRVTTINSAARLMLQPAMPQLLCGEGLRTGEASLTVKLGDIACEDDVAVLERVVRRARRAGRATEQTSLVRASATKVVDTETSEETTAAAAVSAALPVALTATALQVSDTQAGGDEAWGEARGVVLVMEDLSELLAAQRAAAWSEVARRMAHEIKNPLTPIQLSAERIARQFKRTHADSVESTSTSDKIVENPISLLDTSHTTIDSASSRINQVVEECTETIVREVASLKSMVDEFSRFAQLPAAQLAPGDLNETLRQAVALYEGRLEDLRLEMRLAPNLPVALFDSEQMRRVFVNLLENATEAVMSTANGERRITIATGYDARRGVLLAEVADNGHGIHPSDYPRLFQPYFSTRNRGTGLGLAIVHRIVTDHGGRIQVEPNFPRGARFRIELPVEERLAAVESQKVAGQRFAADENNLPVLTASDI